MAEERSLKVLSNDTTFFNKFSNTLTKLLMPTKIGINGMMINIKRNNLIKTYEQLCGVEKNSDTAKAENYQRRYDESYTLYLEAIDKHVMDSIYKKVRNNLASNFEKEALTNYYTVVHLKDTEYLEYKYKKQRFLLDLDYESLSANKKDKTLKKFEYVYVEKSDLIYKGLLKNYSVKLADGVKAKRVNQLDIYKKIFEAIEQYTKNIFPIKLKIDGEKKYEKIIGDYEEFERFEVGKLDERDFLEKNMILLGLSRVLFTHSLPLVAAEQCYKKLLKDTRNLIVSTKNDEKKEKIFQILLKLIEDYNVKLLSTKVYWDNQEDKESYKKFWDAYNKSNSSREKEILSLKRELYDTKDEYEKYADIREYYKDKLVELGVMRSINCSSYKTMRGHFLKNKKWKR